MELKYIDIHAHLNLESFKDDFEAVINQCLIEKVGLINVGTKKVSSQYAIELANKYNNVWATVGLHPIYLAGDSSGEEGESETEFDYGFYKTLADDKRTVGIGECGFDYFHGNEADYKKQREVFCAQIALANEVGKPLMLHLRNKKEGQGRDAYNDALEILKSEAKVIGNVHFYAGTQEQARLFFELGFSISFTGVITFAQIVYEELIKYVPLDMIHAETDCPYVAPVPFRGQRAEPWMVKEVYKKIAEIKGIDPEKVRVQLLENATRHYNLS